MDRIGQSLRVALRAPPQRAQDEGNGRSGRHAPRGVSPHSLGPGDTLLDADAVIFSILPILAILSRCSAVHEPSILSSQSHERSVDRSSSCARSSGIARCQTHS